MCECMLSENNTNGTSVDVQTLVTTCVLCLMIDSHLTSTVMWLLPDHWQSYKQLQQYKHITVNLTIVKMATNQKAYFYEKSLDVPKADFGDVIGFSLDFGK